MGHQAHVHKLQPQAHKPVSPSSRFAPVGCNKIKILRKPKAVETVTVSLAVHCNVPCSNWERFVPPNRDVLRDLCLAGSG